MSNKTENRNVPTVAFDKKTFTWIVIAAGFIGAGVTFSIIHVILKERFDFMKPFPVFFYSCATFSLLGTFRKGSASYICCLCPMAEEVKKGRNFVIFPEGTRSKLGNKLLDFKPGSFKSAVKAKSPIVPAAIMNAFIPFDENHTKPVTVKVFYLEPLYYEEYKEMKTSEIAKEVKMRIEKIIEENT